MQQVCLVVERQGDESVVEMRRHAACGSCGACWVGTEPRRFTVRDPGGHAVGVRVLVELDERGFMGAAALAYLLPVAVGLVGGLLAVGGSGVLGPPPSGGPSASDLRFGLGFFAGVGLTFVVTRLLDGRFRRPFVPVVVGEAPEDEEEEAP